MKKLNKIRKELKVICKYGKGYLEVMNMGGDHNLIIDEDVFAKERWHIKQISSTTYNEITKKLGKNELGEFYLECFLDCTLDDISEQIAWKETRYKNIIKTAIQ